MPSHKFESVLLGQVELEHIGNARPGGLCHGKRLSVFRGSLHGEVARWEGEAVDLGFYVGWFLVFAKEELLLKVPKHVTAVLEAKGLTGNLCVRSGVLYVGRTSKGHQTNCTADLVGHEMGHLLDSCPADEAEAEAFCDVLACAFEEYLSDKKLIPTEADYLIGEDRGQHSHIRDIGRSRVAQGQVPYGPHFDSLRISKRFASIAQRGGLSMVEAARRYVTNYF